MGGHDKTWLVANADDGNTYWGYCPKYSDGYETAFKAKVKIISGYPCRTVRRVSSEPEQGIEIEL